jgi:hypothetical protein
MATGVDGVGAVLQPARKSEIKVIDRRMNIPYLHSHRAHRLSCRQEASASDQTARCDGTGRPPLDKARFARPVKRF